MKKQNFIIPYILYPFDVMVSIGETREEVEKRIEKNYKLCDDERDAISLQGLGKTAMLKGGQTIIRVDRFEHSVIAHEIFHAVSFLMDRISISLTRESEEAFAYAIQYLTKEIYKRAKK